MSVPTTRTLTLPEELHARLLALAQQRGTSLEALVLLALANYVADAEDGGEPRACLSIPMTEAPAQRLTLRYRNVEHVLTASRFRIGSDPNSDLVLDGDDVAPTHALVEQFAGRAFITDPGSQAGVWWRGQRIERKAVMDGDVIRIGTHELSFRRR